MGSRYHDVILSLVITASAFLIMFTLFYPRLFGSTVCSIRYHTVCRVGGYFAGGALGIVGLVARHTEVLDDQDVSVIQLSVLGGVAVLLFLICLSLWYDSRNSRWQAANETNRTSTRWIRLTTEMFQLESSLREGNQLISDWTDAVSKRWHAVVQKALFPRELANSLLQLELATQLGATHEEFSRHGVPWRQSLQPRVGLRLRNVQRASAQLRVAVQVASLDVEHLVLPSKRQALVDNIVFGEPVELLLLTKKDMVFQTLKQAYDQVQLVVEPSKIVMKGLLHPISHRSALISNSLPKNFPVDLIRIILSFYYQEREENLAVHFASWYNRERE